ncbi:histidine phosphatase family protein [Staphylococcus devriesei]|uniref:histidine phosphatase family protein n=1 Tax=Staphylococcus devriesei TaxID=586733 RepID=UPI000E69AEAC|nr:histidine phosphatase family protein [Staphylococcus devriesei]RIL71173.1 histidine phosphatase family protein [Staphylococcus devriesei]
MSKILYLMRHGQTMFNLRGKVQGASDSPLTDLGISQAQKAGQYFKGNNVIFDDLYSSSSERACDTLENVMPGMSYQRLKGLKEWSFGLFEGDSKQLLDALWESKDIFGERLVPFGGETHQDVETRLNSTLIDIMEKSSGTTILAVSHGTAIHAFLGRWIGVSAANNYFIGNCHILKFEYSHHQFKLIEKVDPVAE